jgi:hypothetical protein
MRGTCARALVVALLAAASTAALSYPAFVDEAPNDSPSAIAPPSTLKRVVHIHAHVGSSPAVERPKPKETRRHVSIARRSPALASVVSHRAPVPRHGRVTPPVAAPAPVSAPTAPAPKPAPAPTPSPAPVAAPVVEPERELASSPPAPPPTVQVEPTPPVTAPPVVPDGDDEHGDDEHGHDHGNGNGNGNGNANGHDHEGNHDGHGQGQGKGHGHAHDD